MSTQETTQNVVVPTSVPEVQNVVVPISAPEIKKNKTFILSSDVEKLCLCNVKNFCHDSSIIFRNLFYTPNLVHEEKVTEYALMMYYILLKSFQYNDQNLYNELRQSLGTFIIDVVQFITPDIYGKIEESYGSYILETLVSNDMNFLEAAAVACNFNLFKFLILERKYDVTDENCDWMYWSMYQSDEQSEAFRQMVKNDPELEQYYILSVVSHNEWYLDQLTNTILGKYEKKSLETTNEILQKLLTIENTLNSQPKSVTKHIIIEADQKGDVTKPVVFDTTGSSLSDSE